MLDELLRALEEAGGEQQRPRRSLPLAKPSEPPPALAPAPVAKAEPRPQPRPTALRPEQMPLPPLPAARLRRLLQDPQSLREALVLSVVLGPPLAHRRR